MIIETCWSPWMFYDNPRQGSHAVAAYSLVLSVLVCVLVVHQMTGGDSSQFYLPLFETDINHDMQLYGGIMLAFYASYAAAALLMSAGVSRDLRFMVLPWLLLNAGYCGCLFAYAVWLVYAYYSLLWSTLACMVVVLKAGVHLYCQLCVHSQYQLIKWSQMPIIEVYYPQL